MAAKKRPGRKHKELTEEMERRFLDAIRVGCPIKDACGCAGISESLFYGWMIEADEGKTKRSGRLMEFKKRIKEVEGEATSNWLAVIEEAARNGQWQAAAWKLERRRGMTQTVKQELSGPDGGPIKQETSDARDKLLARLARIAERGEES